MLLNRASAGSKRLVLLATILAVACFAPTVSPAQSFLVKPMSIEITGKPGTSYDIPVEVTNTAADRRQGVDVQLLRLGQNESGWTTYTEAEATPEIKALFPSCLTWTKADKTALEIDPVQIGKVNLHIDIPGSARGFYSAALVIQSRRGAGTGVGIVIRFLIPILIQVEGSVPTISAKVVKASAHYNHPSESGGGTVSVGAVVHNTGQALARATGTVTLSAKIGSQWVRVTSGETAPRRLLPGAQVQCTAELPRKIPSGRYRVDADFKVDGRKLTRYSEEIDVEGDKSVGAITPDAALIVDPAELTLEGAPGATRSANLSLRNPSDKPVSVTVSSFIPTQLQGVALGAIKGEAYSAKDWVTVAPQEFAIGANQERKVRVVVNMPADANLPYYYAGLAAAITLNGESSGVVKMLVIAQNKGFEGMPAMSEATKLAITKGEGSEYSITAAYGNVGNTHLKPDVGFQVTDTAGINTIKQIAAIGDMETALPLSIIRFSGTLDAATLKPGAYTVRATCTFAGKKLTSQVAIKVSATSGGNVVEVVGAAPPANGKGSGSAPGSASKAKNGGSGRRR